MDAIGDGVARGVAAGDGEGHGDATGAGAHVGDVQAFATEHRLAARANFADGEAVERDFNDVFGFRAGNQDVRSDFKSESPEFLLAGEVLRGLAGGAAGNQSKVARGVRRGNFFFRVSVDPGAISA